MLHAGCIGSPGRHCDCRAAADLGVWYGRPGAGAHTAALARAAAQWLPALGAQLGGPERTGTAARTRRTAAAADAMLLLARALAQQAAGAGGRQPPQARAAWLDRHSLLLAPAAEPGAARELSSLAGGRGGLAERSAGEEGAAGKALLGAAAQLGILLQHLERWRASPPASGSDAGAAVCQGSIQCSIALRVNRCSFWHAARFACIAESCHLS